MTLCIPAAIPLCTHALSAQYYPVNERSAAVQTLCSLLPNTAFGLILRKAVLFESDGIGLTADTVGIVRDNTNVQQLFVMLVLDCVLYFVLGYYIERVWPHAYGTRYSPMFFLKPEYWGFRRRDEEVRCRQSPVQGGDLTL